MRKTNCVCCICGKPIYRIPSRINDHPLCSYSCRNRYFSGEKSFIWKGGADGREERRRSFQGREKERLRRIARKQRAIDMLGGACSICGYNKCNDALDFHHIDPAIKVHEIKYFSMMSWEKIENEVKKCVLLCANCHREKHWEERHGQKVTAAAL